MLVFDDMISRSVLLSALCTDCANGKISLDGCCESGCEVVNLIRSMPTIEAEPVRHERWALSEVNMDGFCYKCTGCGQKMQTKFRCDEVCKYCPECGAKMKENEDETD